MKTVRRATVPKWDRRTVPVSPRVPLTSLNDVFNFKGFALPVAQNGLVLPYI